MSPSRTSPTNRYAFASAAGPRKSGSDSIELHSDTQQPHMMQSDSLEISALCAGVTRHSRSGGSTSELSSHGLTDVHLVPERRHVDDQVLDHRQVAHRRDGDVWPASTNGFMAVLQASTAPPSMRMPHEPQTAIRHDLR